MHVSEPGRPPGNPVLGTDEIMSPQKCNEWRMSKGQSVDDMESTSDGSIGGSYLLDRQDDEEEDEVEGIEILCELVGARDLRWNDVQEAGDLEPDSLRPFCIIKFGDRIIHQSKVAHSFGPNPIWTLSTKSLFLLRATPVEMADSILSIGIYSKREISMSARLKNDADHLQLGKVCLHSNEILSRCDQHRFEVNIKGETGDDITYLGRLALRFQVATESDREIVGLFSQNLNLSKEHSRRELSKRMLQSSRSLIDMAYSRPQATLCTEIDEKEIAQESFVSAFSSMCSTRRLTNSDSGETMVKVKPYPDPMREGDTMFMSAQSIHDETRQPSHKWVDAGSGSLGRLYCEVLACHDLPNVDVGEFMGNVTDSFVCLVFEDSCAMTEVINDELSPHWLPWTQRAFCFGMMHPASILYLGVFDYDLGTSHEPIGRVAVNVSNLQRNTVHTLKYNLYPSSNVTERTPAGSITIRIRIDCSDEKAALLVALQPRPKIFVNVKKHKSFKVVRYTCFGEYDGEEKFDMTVMRSYINEFFEYKAEFGYAVRDAFSSLVFWRGQVEIFSFMLPLYSLLFFCMAADFVERPFMFIPYTCFCVAGIMLANLNIRRQHPSPWSSCPSFWHYIHILRTGKTPTPVASIKEYERYEEEVAYEKAWNDRLEQDRILAEKCLKLQQELHDIGDDNISTKTSPSAIPVDILARLTRYQGMAGVYCGYLRFVKVIVTWEESIVSFWITAVLLAVGVTTMFLPWRFLLTWIGRAVVWCFLGPHMKIVDLYQKGRKNDGALDAFVQQFDVARLRREEALKKQDIKSIAFGKYSTQVPSFNIGRCR
jgi:C2 domain